MSTGTLDALASLVGAVALAVLLACLLGPQR